jgi:hypothetical protein
MHEQKGQGICQAALHVVISDSELRLAPPPIGPGPPARRCACNSLSAVGVRVHRQVLHHSEKRVFTVGNARVREGLGRWDGAMRYCKGV